MRDRLNSPDISVVVPVRNGAGSLAALLRSLEAQTLDRHAGYALNYCALAGSIWADVVHAR